MATLLRWPATGANRTRSKAVKALDDAGKGRQLAELLGLPEPDDSILRNEFHHRFLGLALEAYRRGEISRGKLWELATMVDLKAADLDRLVEDAGVDGDEPALARTR